MNKWCKGFVWPPARIELRITVGKGEAKTKGYSQKVIVWGQ